MLSLCLALPAAQLLRSRLPLQRNAQRRVSPRCIYRGSKAVSFALSLRRACVLGLGIFTTSALRRSSDFPRLLRVVGAQLFNSHSKRLPSVTALRTEFRTRVASDLLAPASPHVSWSLGTSTPALRCSSGFCVRASYRVRHSTTSLSKNFSRS